MAIEAPGRPRMHDQGVVGSWHTGLSAMNRGAGLTLGLALAVLWACGSTAHAVCSDNAPTTGQTVTCDTSQPNPDLNGVIAEAGSTEVTVDILSGAGISTSGSDVTAVLVRTDSEVDNEGIAIASGEGNPFAVRGLFADGSDNLLSNGGTSRSWASRRWKNSPSPLASSPRAPTTRWSTAAPSRRERRASFQQLGAASLLTATTTP
jgi:hypothetical protein